MAKAKIIECEEDKDDTWNLTDEWKKGEGRQRNEQNEEVEVKNL